MLYLCDNSYYLSDFSFDYKYATIIIFLSFLPKFVVAFFSPVNYQLIMIYTKPVFDTTTRFNELLNLWEANETKNKQVTEETFKTLGHLFLNYHVEKIFALTLLHKHFLLNENEILLETGSLSGYQRKVISQPVEVNKLASSVEGFNWMVTPDKSYLPYEFKYEDKDNVSNYK